VLRPDARAGDFTGKLVGFEGEKLVLNDILADPRGCVHAGTRHWGPEGMEKPGRLCLIDLGASPRLVDDGIELANGLGLSPDDRTLYFADSAARRIYAYDVDPAAGVLSRKRVFARIPAEDGIPDGLTVGAEGFVWCALWCGGQVVRFDPAGKVERRIRLPARQTSSLAFGGDDLRDLCVTSAAEPWRSDLAPSGYRFDAGSDGGSLFRIRLEVQGKRGRRAVLRGGL